MANESICRGCFHSYVCEQFNEHRNSNNQKCHFFNDHFVPAADVAEVKHGRWNEHYDKERELWYFDCPFCGDDYSAITKWHQNYCSNCGARMDGE